MQFTESEIRFLMGSHHETAAGTRTLTPMTDLRQLGCPLAIFTKVLESRAARLGDKFLEFRSGHRAVVTEPSTLESEIANSKLF